MLESPLCRRWQAEVLPPIQMEGPKAAAGWKTAQSQIEGNETLRPQALRRKPGSKIPKITSNAAPVTHLRFICHSP